MKLKQLVTFVVIRATQTKAKAGKKGKKPDSALDFSTGAGFAVLDR